jgi:general secretion pathway protein E
MTGYRGRTGIYEMLEVTSEIKKLINVSPSIEALRQQGIRQGMRTLRVSGAMKVAQGVTTIEEVLKVAPAHDL